MNKILTAVVLVMAAIPVSFARAPVNPVDTVSGFWQTIDDKTGSPKSIVRLYGCEDKLCGRIVAIYDSEGSGKITETLANPVKVADKVKGSPKTVGLDIIWGMKWDDKEFSGGKIMDPQSGSVYSSVIWQDDADIAAGKLRVRGKIGPFGRTQVWETFDVKNLPADLKKIDVSKWTPVIIK